MPVVLRQLLVRIGSSDATNVFGTQTRISLVYLFLVRVQARRKNEKIKTLSICFL